MILTLFAFKLFTISFTKIIIMQKGTGLANVAVFHSVLHNPIILWLYRLIQIQFCWKIIEKKLFKNYYICYKT